MKITITQEHIDKGCQTQGDNCPAALALLERVEPGKRVYVYSYGAQVGTQDEGPFVTERCYIHSESLFQFIRQFDRTGKASPGEYELVEATEEAFNQERRRRWAASYI